MNLLSGLLGPLKLTPSQWYRMSSEYIPWAVKCNASCQFLLAVYYEQMLDLPLAEVRQRLGFIPFDASTRH